MRLQRCQLVAKRSSARYAIAGGKEGKQRLDLLSDAMRPSTLELLDSAGLKAGDQCLDAGCGGGHVARDMARIVGPTGHVIGIDFDPHVLEFARADAKEARAEQRRVCDR